jgi:hypothetical protein
MNGLLLLIICVALLACGYIFYGGWLCKQWGVGESKEETPAHTVDDGGVDYVPAKAAVLLEMRRQEVENWYLRLALSIAQTELQRVSESQPLHR